VAQAGYTEIFTLSLVLLTALFLSWVIDLFFSFQCGVEDNFASLRRKDDGSAVKLANPATVEFQVGRDVRLLIIVS